MSDQMGRSSRGSFPPVVAGLIGLGIGAVAAGAIFWMLMLRQQARHEAQMAATAVQVANVPDIRNFGAGPVFDMRGGDDAKVKKFGTDFIEDLENNRLQSAYRSMTPEYQMKTKREVFDMLILDNPAVRRLTSYDRVEKVRKGADDSSIEFYLTATERGAEVNKNKVNFALTIVKVSDEWRVANYEIDADSKPKK